MSVGMDWTLFAAFVAATLLLAVFPGPNMALVVATSVRRGTRYGLLTVAGSATGLALQLVVVALGMSTLLAAAGAWFTVIRLAGAAYLVVLGLQAWRAPPPTLQAEVGGASARAVMLRGLAVTLTNPKVLLFFGAFFPQFIAASRPLAPQLAVMSVTFVAIVAGTDSVWAVLAGRARGWFVRQGRAVNRLSGGLLMGAGVGLALVRR